MRTLVAFAALQGAGLVSREAAPVWVTLVSIAVLFGVIAVLVRAALREDPTEDTLDDPPL